MNSSEFLQSVLNGDEDAIQAMIRANQRQVFQLALSILDTTRDDPGQAAAQAEIATRETFIRAIDRIGRYREDIPFATWLNGITIHASLRRYRRWKFAQRAGKIFGRPLNRLRRFFQALGLSASRIPKVRLPDWRKARADAGGAPVRSAAEEAPPPAPPAPVMPPVAPPPSLPPDATTGLSGLAGSDEALWNAVRGLDERLRLPVVLRYYHDFPVAEISRLLRISEGAVHARLDKAREKLAAVRE